MVIARNIGRLGNNMFQIAAAIGYARKYGYEWAADSASGRGEPYSNIHEIYSNLPKGQPSGYRHHEHNHGICSLHNCSTDICHFNYHPIPDLGPNVTLSGFFQSYKYFEGAEEEIRKVFALQHRAEYEDCVSIHVRRGDYVDHSGSFPPIDSEYITKAMGMMMDKRAVKQFVFFSDDIQWCRDRYNLLGDTIEFTITGEKWNLEKMASCSHHIIANSTWSWWGAFLGHNPNRMVISPSYLTPNWFGPTGGVKDPVDLLPAEWHQIKFR